MKIGNKIVAGSDVLSGFITITHHLGDTYTGQPVITIERERHSGDIDVIPRITSSEVLILLSMLQQVLKEVSDERTS